MSTSIRFVLLFCLLSFLTPAIYGQEAQGNVFIVTNFERAFPEGGMATELDKLQAEYNEYVFAKNEYLISYKVVRHWWGNDNRDFIYMLEVKSWDDIMKAQDRNDELFMEHWSTKEAQDQYNKDFNKYFTGKHSDEIYREVK